MNRFAKGLAVTLGAMGLTLVAATAMGLDRLAFSGGPEGGTFQYFSNGIAIRLSKNLSDVEVSNTNGQVVASGAYVYHPTPDPTSVTPQG